MTITDDETRLIDGAKGSLYDSLLNSIDDKFQLTSFFPQKELIPYLEEKKPETKEEAQNCRRLYDQWTDGVLRALKRKPKTAETLEELFTALPEPFRGNLIQALGSLIAEQKGAKPWVY